MGAFVARVRAELQLQRLDYDDLDNGEWIAVFGSSSNRCCMRDPSTYYTFELLQALVVTGIWIWGFVDGCGMKFFIYLTYWSLTAQLVYVWLDFFTVYMANRMSAGKCPRVKRMPWYARATWCLFDILMPTTFLVFVLYFSLVVNWNYPPTRVLAYVTHGGNFALMMLDAVFSRKPYYLLHGVYFAIEAFIYLFFTYLFFLAGGTACDGMPYIYGVLDWGGKFRLAGTLGVIIFFVVAPVVNIIFWLLVSFVFPGLRPRPDTSAESVELARTGHSLPDVT